jgi:hypothetical protein
MRIDDVTLFWISYAHARNNGDGDDGGGDGGDRDDV